ncbi:MAG: hypothetical protein JXB60_00785 [Candidatus Cloacimonetes bacterium]|nr:hypothetical protein [Candidatus Cloacimonadota bacterium]
MSCYQLKFYYKMAINKILDVAEGGFFLASIKNWDEKEAIRFYLTVSQGNTRKVTGMDNSV